MQIAIAICLVVWGIVFGTRGAFKLRRVSMDDSERQRALVGFAAGFVIWLFFGVVFFLSPFSVVTGALFIAILAIYLPPMLVLLLPRTKHS